MRAATATAAELPGQPSNRFHGAAVPSRLVRCGDRRQHRSEEPMHPTSPCPEQDPPHDRHHQATLYASLELSRSVWLVTSLAPGGGRMSKHSVAAGDGAALLALLARLRGRVERSAGGPVGVVVIQEAGMDGFWVHRLLEAEGVESRVVDPGSVAAPRRQRRAKTDAVDGETLLRTLLAWRRGEPRVCAMVRPPSPGEEDRRRTSRERGTLLEG